MGVIITKSTLPGGRTPICNECGILLCWDVDEEEYQGAKAFWEAWTCKDCNGGIPLSRKAWMADADRANDLSDFFLALEAHLRSLK